MIQKLPAHASGLGCSPVERGGEGALLWGVLAPRQLVHECTFSAPGKFNRQRRVEREQAIQLGVAGGSEARESLQTYRN